jgi:LPS-assembly lipoprotein
MWWSERLSLRRLGQLGVAMAAASLLAGCFQPLYGDRSVTASPGMSEKMSLVDIAPIDAPNGRPEARLGVEIRNALLFGINKDGSVPNPNYRLKINLSTTRQQVIVDIYTTRPDVENYGIDATYSLIDIATGKTVLNGQTFARVSYDVPGQQQRFARARGLRDAENRAAKVIADQILSRLASYFVAGA